MPWTNFLFCPDAVRIEDQQQFNLEFRRWLRMPKQDGLLSLIRAIPIGTLLRVHIADSTLHLTAITPPNEAVMFPVRGEWSVSRPTMLRDGHQQVNILDPRVACLFYYVDAPMPNNYAPNQRRKGNALVRLDYIDLQDLVQTSTFKLAAQYPLDDLNLRLLVGGD